MDRQDRSARTTAPRLKRAARQNYGRTAQITCFAHQIAVLMDAGIASQKGARAMRIAVASGDGMFVDQHFGHATQFLICEASDSGFCLVEVRRNDAARGAPWAPGQEDSMERSACLVADCQAVLVARIGECGVERLADHGIEAFELPGLIETALRQFNAGAPATTAATAPDLVP